jgi:PAS domain S-box-containing protein
VYVVSAIAAVWLLILLAIRFAVPDPSEAVAAFFALPIALVAVELGIVPGLICAIVSVVLIGVWDVGADVHLNLGGYLERASLFFPTAFLVGIGANRLRVAIEANERTSALVRRIVESTSDAHVSIDEQGTIVGWNPAAEQTFGWSAKEAIGKPGTIVVPDGLREAFESLLSGFREGDQSTIGTRSETRARDRNGREFPVEVWVSAVRTEGAWTLTAAVRDISERRQEEDVRRRLAAIVESSDDAIFSFAPDWRILTWNVAAERIFGYSEDEAVGMSAGLLVAPDRPDVMGSMLARVVEGERVADMRTVCAAKGGRRVDVALGMSPIADEEGSAVAVSAIARDISARMLTEGYIKAEHRAVRVLASARAAAEVLPKILPIIGDAGRWNCGLSWMYDETDDRLRCDGVWVEPATSVQHRIAEIGDTTDLTTDTRLPMWYSGEPDASSLPCPAEAKLHGMKTQLWVPIVIGDSFYGAFQLFDRRTRDRDDELVAVMTSVATLIGSYVRRRSAEEEAERAKDDFFALVSHELRTPLTSIIGYTDLVAEVEADRLSEQGRDFLEIIRRNAGREMRLVADLLLLVKIREGTFAVDLDESADLERIVGESVEAARPAAGRREISLSSSIASTPRLRGDPHRLGQVVDNLISNAIKFTPIGGQVDVRLASSNGTAAIEVADTGAGVPDEERDRLFDRLYRASGATRAHVPGLGLGLTIVKAIVDAHGGTVGLASGEDGGTTFRVELPLTRKES